MIAVDWGTSSLRTYQLAEDGRVLAHRHEAVPLLACQGRFASVLAGQLDGWNDELVLMAGMVGSRNGWQEVAYAPCPAGLAELSAQLHALEGSALPGRRVLIAPGLANHPPGSTPEVMRGEETQLMGLIDQLEGPGPHTLCLPGTHSKWVTVEAGRVTGFHTAMTGELYAVLSQHSLLGALMDKGAADDEAAFARGLAQSLQPGGLPNHLFSVRSLSLFGELTAAASASYLSGLLIGHELAGLAPAHGGVHLIGGATLTLRYERALQARGLSTHTHAESLTARGLHRLAQTAGLA